MHDEPRCTLAGGTCYCTGRAGCERTNEDSWDDPDAGWDDGGEPLPDDAQAVETIQPAESYL